MTAVLLMPLAAGEPARYASLAAALAILVGGLCLLGRLARLGSWLTCCPNPFWSDTWPGSR